MDNFKLESEDLVVDDGLKVYTFSNKLGEKFGEFAFNAGDVGIVERYDEAIEQINAIKDEDATTTEGLTKISNVLIEQIEHILNRPVRDTLFNVYKPTTVFNNGDFYAEVIINRIASAIEKECDVRLDKKMKKISKYTDKYTK